MRTLSHETAEVLRIALANSHRSNPILFCFVSTALAAVGLATNSQTTILGAMLLSPITSVINKSNLSWVMNHFNLNVKTTHSFWLKSLLIILVTALIVSFLLGKLLSVTTNPFTGERLVEKWPTQEMQMRANPVNAIYMIFIALMCSIVLPFTILSSSSSGVRVVAIGIATALIPPLANIGIALAMPEDSEDKDRQVEIHKFRRYAAITGAAIFFINLFLLWIPSRYILAKIVEPGNFFHRLEKFFA